MSLTEIGFGGGCHWCTEAVFVSLKGVQKVSQGYIGSRPPNDGLSEAVVVTFEPKDIPLKVLIEIHLRTHASTSNHKMRSKYRSAIYTFSDEQADVAQNILVELQREIDDKLVTRILHHSIFKSSDNRYLQYYEKNAEGPFCARHIDPKLSILRTRYADWMKER